jgi:hypothetical protein
MAKNSAKRKGALSFSDKAPFELLDVKKPE